MRGENEDAARGQDPYATGLDQAQKLHIEGEVKDVDRTSTAQGEQVVLTIAASDGTTKKVALGPSWFINAAPVTPMRGDKVTVDAYALPRDPDELSAASSVRIGGRGDELRLRDSQGSPAWSMKTQVSPDAYNAPYWRYVLTSDLKGKRVDCRGVECGKVDDLFVERNSGQIAMVSIDPNANFLGIADTKRLVPWSVATVSLDGVVRLDASKEMVLASPETPKDADKLNEAMLNQVYHAYQVSPPRFETTHQTGMVPAASTNDPWNHQGVIITAIDPASARTISGKITDITKVTFSGDIKPAKAIRVSANDGEELILLGPAWYMDNQDMRCKEGDTVSVDARRTTINGKDYWIASTVDHGGHRVVLLDASGPPAWDRR
jgi:sporulation protein YlmC with PRC-barrel domain